MSENLKPCPFCGGLRRQCQYCGACVGLEPPHRPRAGKDHGVHLAGFRFVGVEPDLLAPDLDVIAGVACSPPRAGDPGHPCLLLREGAKGAKFSQSRYCILCVSGHEANNITHVRNVGYVISASVLRDLTSSLSRFVCFARASQSSISQPLVSPPRSSRSRGARGSASTACVSRP